MDIDKIIEGLSGKRKQACEAAFLRFSTPYAFWELVASSQWGKAADFFHSENSGSFEAEMLADMLWEG